jgi:ribose transport system permease protein
MKEYSIVGFKNKNPWVWSFLGAAILCVLIGIISGGISTQTIFLNITLSTFTFLLGICEMLIITSGDGAIDMCIPYIATLCAYISANWLVKGKVLPGLLILLAVCVVIGVINWLINYYLHVHAMISTLAVGYIIYTIILVYSKSATVKPSKALMRFAQMNWGGFSPITIICILFLLFMIIVMYHTKFGKRLHAMGQGHHIAELAGINISKMMLIVFVASSLIAGFTGVLLGAYVNGSFQTLGNSYQMPAIAAALIGGTLVSGGKSSVLGTYGGAILLTLLTSLINITGLAAGWQNFIEGIVVILILVAAKK